MFLKSLASVVVLFATTADSVFAQTDVGADFRLRNSENPLAEKTQWPSVLGGKINGRIISVRKVGLSVSKKRGKVRVDDTPIDQLDADQKAVVSMIVGKELDSKDPVWKATPVKFDFLAVMLYDEDQKKLGVIPSAALKLSAKEKDALAMLLAAEVQHEIEVKKAKEAEEDRKATRRAAEQAAEDARRGRRAAEEAADEARRSRQQAEFDRLLYGNTSDKLDQLQRDTRVIKNQLDWLKFNK